MTPGSLLLVAAFAATTAVLLRSLAIVRARRDRERLAEARLLRRLVALPSTRAVWSRVALVAAGAGALAAAGTATRDDTASSGGGAERAVETVLVLDASNSMRAEDVEPSRLERQKALARRLVLRLPGRIGIVYFAGNGYVLSPLTTDRNALLLYVDEVDPAAVGRGGTSLAGGLEQALRVLGAGDADARKSAVIFSDGEVTTEEPAADAPPGAYGADDVPSERLRALLSGADAAGIRLHTVGLGTDAGGPIPLPDAGPAVPLETSRARGLDGLPSGGLDRGREVDAAPRYLRDSDGEVVITRLEEASLRTVARTGEGSYVAGTHAGIDRLLRTIVAGRAREADAAAGIPGALLLIAFGLLWGEAYVFRRG